jgi:hypothetical protein
MLKLSEKAVGKRAYSLMEEAKAQVPGQFSGLLRMYDCQRDAKSNIKLVLEATAGSPPSNEAMLNAFNAWILAILHKQNEVLNEQAMAVSLQELTRPDAKWQKYRGKSDLKVAILGTIIQTVEQFQRELGRTASGKEKSGGILSFLKRK